ncbi:uncharacterized protein [Temnothorax nylanderi]|uniref:uncharacterized protein isoform X2 n=1 Tax=Temnothorax nylanderi TaxID=102681 RepID=UPI003A8AA7EA
MFYPVELFSHRRRGKLAPCWLAATVSEKLFKRHYNSGAIKKINTVETCKQILEIMQLRNRSDRFSLYLSSQLMYGITRIHRLQVVYYQKEVFEMQQKCDSGGGGGGGLEKKEDEYDAVQDLELPAIYVPISTQNFPNAQLEIDLHLLPHEEFDDRLWIIVDRMDELQISKERSISKKMADITIEEIQEKQLSQEIRRPVLVDIWERNKSKEVLLLTPQKRQPHEMQVETPTKRRRMQDAACCDFGASNDEELDFMLEHDFNLSLDRIDELQISKERSISKKMADITVEEIQEKQLSQEIRRPVLVDISERNKSKEVLLLTPQKRQPHQMQVETPTKRRRLFFETASATDVPPVEDVAVPPAPVEDVAVPAELPIEETRMLVLPQQEETDMELESLDSSYFVIRRHSKKSKIIDQKIVLSDKQLQKWRQNVNIHCKKLDKPLTKNFTEELSTFQKTETAIAAEPGDSVANVLTVTNIIHETMDVSMVPLPEEVPEAIVLEEGTTIVEQRPDQERINISNDESFEDIDILLERQRQSPKTKHIPVPSTSPSRPSQPALISKEILALLEVLWYDKEVVKFSELISADTHTREDAATAFEILLDLYAQEKIVLQQTDCSDTLWISKYQD